MDMNVVIQIILCSVIGGQAMMMDNNCRNDGSNTLSNCLSNPNIRIQKIQKMGGIKSYRLSLHSQNIWWVAENEWIKCDKLCKVCESLPEINDEGKHIWPAS